MRGFATSSNPYTTGLKPRSFFSGRKSLIHKNIMINGLNTEAAKKLAKDFNSNLEKPTK